MNYIIRNTSGTREIAGLFNLLQICFTGLSKKYLFKRLFACNKNWKNESVILLKNKQIVSHVHLFRKQIWWGRGKASFCGMGFICTKPESRGMGCATSLLRDVIKNNNACLFGLFTKIPGYYKTFGFKIVPRDKIVIKKGDFKNILASGPTIRKFMVSRDILSVMKIHNSYFKCKTGVLIRNLSDWKAQLSYFNEEKRLFLVAESDNRIKAYIRCKLIKPFTDKIEIVEYASIGRNTDLISDFISHLFNKFSVNEIRGWSCFLKPALKNTTEYKEEIDTKMMLRFNNSYRQSDLKKDGLCFLESDGF